MEQGLAIRPLCPRDVPQMVLLEQACFSVPWSARSLLAECSNPLAVYRTAWLGEQLAGYAGMHHILDEGHITNVAVSPALRRRGIARALLEELLLYAREHGLSLLTLEVRASNSAAIALYAAYGFREMGLRPHYYTCPTEGALIMTRDLAGSDRP